MPADANANDYDWVTGFLGVPVPRLLRELHDSRESDSLENIFVDHIDDPAHDDELYFCIAYWIRQSQVEYKQDSHYGTRRLLLTRDPCGNICYALPEEEFTTVYAFNHETLESECLTIDIPTFVALARHAKYCDR